jgi:hypothetical protein
MNRREALTAAAAVAAGTALLNEVVGAKLKDGSVADY